MGSSVGTLGTRAIGSIPVPGVPALRASRSAPALLQFIDGFDRPAPSVRPVMTPLALSSAPYPITLGSKIKVYASLLADDAEYRRGIVAISVNQLGDGLVSGGFLVLLDVLGVVTHSLSIQGLAIFTLVEIIIAAVSHVCASHQRDNAEAKARAGKQGPADKASYGKQLLWSGVIDLGAAALLVGGAVGTACFRMGSSPLFIVLTLVKAVQAFNKSYETGSWSCLKYTLGTAQTQARQRDLKSTISALEIGAGALLYGVGSLATYQAAQLVSTTFPFLFVPLTIGVIVAGGLMTCIPKLYFLGFCQISPSTPRGVRGWAPLLAFVDTMFTSCYGSLTMGLAGSLMPAGFNDAQRKDHRQHKIHNAAHDTNSR